MGRPKGSKNKSTTEKEQTELKLAEIPVVKSKTKASKTETVAKAEKVVNVKDFILATTELAIIAGREYIVQKLMGWLSDTAKTYPGQQLKLVVVEADGHDEYQLWLDGTWVDSRHIFKADVDDVIRGVLGAR